MSELIQQKNNRATAKWQLLASVSALTLLANAASQVRADDAGHPTVWIELGGQLEASGGFGDRIVPPFVDSIGPDFTSPTEAQAPPHYGYGAEGKLSFQPNGSDWVFSASVRYGRATTHGHSHEESPKVITSYAARGRTIVRTGYANLVDVTKKHDESHAIVDFEVGRDFGLGLLGRNAKSQLNLGVRFAQFQNYSNVGLGARPDSHWEQLNITFGGRSFTIRGNFYHHYSAGFEASRNFHGVGPSLSWDSSANLIGQPEDGEVSLDWGANFAVLFGRQRAAVQHHTSGLYHYIGGFPPAVHNVRYTNSPVITPRSRTVTVPNLGGFAGLSFNYPSAKVSFGYRADVFFGAMDVGIDARQSSSRNFYGPFATVSIGLGG